MNRFTLAVVLLVAGATTVRAQALTPPIPIHGHPEIAAYTDQSQRPTESAQIHWSINGHIVPVGDMSLTHTHVDLSCWRDRVVTASFPCNFALTLHMTPGHISRIVNGFDGQEGQLGAVEDIVWDTVPAPVAVRQPWGYDMDFACPTETCVVRGHFMMDPTVAGLTHHGHLQVYLDAATTFPNGDQTNIRMGEPVYSEVDLTQPEQEVDSTHAVLVLGRVTSAAHQHTYDWQYVRVDNPLPILPLAQPWPVAFTSYDYGLADTTRVAESQYRTDFDFHAGVQGTVRWTVTSDLNPSPVRETILDPAVLGSGPHKVGFIRNLQNVDEQVVTLLVTTIGVGISVPPPTTCTDPGATNNGGPLPCTYPPPAQTCETVVRVNGVTQFVSQQSPFTACVGAHP